MPATPPPSEPEPAGPNPAGSAPAAGWTPEQSARLQTLRGGRVCVTGGAGFVGGHVCDALLALGASISILDDCSNTDGVYADQLVSGRPERVTFRRGSILDADALARAVEGCDLVLHLAAVGSVPRSIAHPERTWEVNATGTLRVLEAARSAGVRRVVLAGSSSAYGKTAELPKTETMTPSPWSPYAASKLSAEQLCLTWVRSYANGAGTNPARRSDPAAVVGSGGVSLGDSVGAHDSGGSPGPDTVCLRYFNIFGPRQRADSAYAAVVPAFISRLLRSEPPTIFGDGGHSRDFTYVDNAVLATLLAGARPEPLGGAVINVGAGERTTIVELARLISRAVTRTTGRAETSTPEPEFRPARPGDVDHSLADIERARSELGYEPIVGVTTGIERTVAAFVADVGGRA